MIRRIDPSTRFFVAVDHGGGVRVSGTLHATDAARTCARVEARNPCPGGRGEIACAATL